MKNTLIGGLCLGTVAMASVAWAGYHYTQPVVVISNIEAYGSLHAARYSSDSNQYIGCYTNLSSLPVWATCFAGDATSHYTSCGTSDANLIGIIKTINEESYVQFNHTNGTCTYIYVENSSYYQ